MYKRLLKIQQDAQHSVFIFGPRGTGKTSWLKSHFAEALYIDLLNDALFSELSAQPSRLSEKIPTSLNQWIIIDEIQKIPALLNEVHRLIEARGQRFILTGSSARSLRRAGVNLLAGRALTYHMHPFTAEELQEDFNCEQALLLGGLPAIASHENPKKYLTSYVQTYLKEEVLFEGLTRNIMLFNRFLEAASFSQGGVLNYTEVAREVGSNRHTVSNFFDILDDLLIGIRIPVFQKRAKRRLTQHMKFYFFDVGVYRAIRPTGPLDSAEEIDGAVMETLFLQQLRAINDYYELNYQIFYWRTQAHHEVDFVLYGPRGLHAFEIKRKRVITKKDTKALRLFADDYPEAQLHLIYGGSESQYEGPIMLRPFCDTIAHLIEILK